MELNKRIIKLVASCSLAIAVLISGTIVIAKNYKEAKQLAEAPQEEVFTTIVSTTTTVETTEPTTTTTTTITTTKNNNKKTTTTAYNPISVLTINKPNEYVSLSEFKDINIEFTGGDNADEKYIYIYENSTLLKKETLTENSYTIRSTALKNETFYRVVIEAVKDNYKRNDSIYISTIKDGRQKMVNLAVQQDGNKGTTYWTWYGHKGFIEWCAIFVSWVGYQNGYVQAGVIPKFKGCGSGVRWFKERNQFKLRSSGYIPLPGDIIFFDYFPENTMIDHVGIVVKTDGQYVYTVEGNVGSVSDTSTRRVKQKKYKLKDAKIYGYGVPNY